ncbi:MAG: O-antigen ligase family protein [Chloroflexia bacterium]
MATVRAGLGDNGALRTLGLALGALALGLAGGVAVAAGNPLIPFALLAAVLPLPWLLTRPQADLWLVAAVITLLPFGTLPAKIGFTPTLLEVGILLLAGVAIFAGSRADDPAWRGLVRSPLDGAVLLFIGVISFAFVLGLGRDSSTEIVHNYIKLLLAIALFFLVGQVLRTADAIRRFMQVLILSGGLAAAIGLVLWRLPQPLAERLLLYLQPIGYPMAGVLRFVEAGPALGKERAIGTSVDPNSFAGLLVVLIALTLTQLLGKRPCLPRPLLAAIVAAEAAALVFTYSRTALVAVLAAALLVGALRYRKLAIALLVTGVAVVLSGLGGSYTDRLVSGFLLQDQAQLMRISEFQNAGTIIARYPFFGVGFGQAGELDLTTGVSSIYLTITERTGLLGMAAFAAVIIGFFLLLAPFLPNRPDPPTTAPALSEYPHSERSEESEHPTPHSALRTPHSDLDATLLGAAAAVLGALVVGLADHYFFNTEQSHLTALLWLCLALGLSARRLLIAECGVRSAE